MPMQTGTMPRSRRVPAMRRSLLAMLALSMPSVSMSSLSTLALAAWSPVASAAAAQERYEGLAYASGSQRLLYRETHWRYADQGVPTRLVLYRCPDGTAFARKRLREVPSAVAPDFDFIDGRSGYREGVRTRAGERRVYWQPRAGTRERAQVLKTRANVVIDAGFDAYIRSHWNAIAGGKPLAAAFLLPSRLGTLDFRIGKPADAVVDGQPARTLRMAVDAWYGFAAPEIELAYATSDRRLLRFEGIGTIRDAAGRNQPVRIEFPGRSRLAGAARHEIDAAIAAPLADRCKP